MTLTSEQVDAITHAWLDLRAASKEQVQYQHLAQLYARIGFPEESRQQAELSIACRDSVKELEEAFPFLLEIVGYFPGGGTRFNGVDDE